MSEFTEKQIRAAINWADEIERYNETCGELNKEYLALQERWKESLDKLRKAKAKASYTLPHEGYIEVPTVRGILKIEKCLDDYDIINLPIPCAYPF